MRVMELTRAADLANGELSQGAIIDLDSTMDPPRDNKCSPAARSQTANAVAREDLSENRALIWAKTPRASITPSSVPQTSTSQGEHLIHTRNGEEKATRTPRLLLSSRKKGTDTVAAMREQVRHGFDIFLLELYLEVFSVHVSRGGIC